MSPTPGPQEATQEAVLLVTLQDVLQVIETAPLKPSVVAANKTRVRQAAIRAMEGSMLPATLSGLNTFMRGFRERTEECLQEAHALTCTNKGLANTLANAVREKLARLLCKLVINRLAAALIGKSVTVADISIDRVRESVLKQFPQAKALVVGSGKAMEWPDLVEELRARQVPKQIVDRMERIAGPKKEKVIVIDPLVFIENFSTTRLKALALPLKGRGTRTFTVRDMEFARWAHGLLMRRGESGETSDDRDPVWKIVDTLNGLPRRTSSQLLATMAPQLDALKEIPGVPKDAAALAQFLQEHGLAADPAFVISADGAAAWQKKLEAMLDEQLPETAAPEKDVSVWDEDGDQ